MIDCRIERFRSLLLILNIQILGLEMISSLQRVEFAVEVFVELSVLKVGFTESEEIAGPAKRDISMIMR